ncbi:MAG TPA: GntR family transcriptional regulator [Terriglobales bacterium]|nr:GntR family transcriptional regulator [Terriglobales bacterium]
MPAYQRIQATILKRIENRQLKPGDVVDSERELAKIHQVSLMTARHALMALEREGIVQRRRGAGTFVAPPKVHFNKLTSFTEQMASRGLTACSKVLSFGLVDNEAEVAARLALAANTRLLKLERLRIAADEPFAVETCYLSAEEFSAITRGAVARGSLFSILETVYGIQIAYADEEMDATIAAPATANLLKVARDQPLLRIRQLIYSTKGKATLYVLGLYRSDRHTLLVRRFR